MQVFSQTRFDKFVNRISSIQLSPADSSSSKQAIAVVGSSPSDIATLSDTLSDLMLMISRSSSNSNGPLVAIHTGTDIDGDNAERPALPGGPDALLALCDPSATMTAAAQTEGGAGVALKDIIVITSPASAKARSCYCAAGFNVPLESGLLFDANFFDVEDVLVFLCGAQRRPASANSGGGAARQTLAGILCRALQEERRVKCGLLLSTKRPAAAAGDRSGQPHEGNEKEPFAPMKTAIAVLTKLSIDESPVNAAIASAATEMLYFATTFLQMRPNMTNTVDAALKRLLQQEHEQHVKAAVSSFSPAILIDLSDSLLPRRWVQRVVALLCRRVRRWLALCPQGGSVFFSNVHNIINCETNSNSINGVSSGSIDSNRGDEDEGMDDEHVLVNEITHLVAASRSAARSGGLSLNTVLHSATPRGIPASVVGLLAEVAGSRGNEVMDTEQSQQQQMRDDSLVQQRIAYLAEQEQLEQESFAAAAATAAGDDRLSPTSSHSAQRPAPLRYEGIAASLYALAVAKSLAGVEQQDDDHHDDGDDDDDENTGAKKAAKAAAAAADPTHSIQVAEFIALCGKCERLFSAMPKHSVERPILETAPDGLTIRLTLAGVEMAEECCPREVLRSAASLESLHAHIARRTTHVSKNIVFTPK